MASDKAIDEKNIKILRNLQKLPENKRCFNCDSLGTTYVVPQFSIFVCTDCSGIHMQCGQRVKSISMAKFTTEEVKGLQDGGNEVAGRKFLAKYTQNDLQKPVDKNPKKIEQWVRMVFVERQFYSDAPVASKASEAGHSSSSVTSKGMAAPPAKATAPPPKPPSSSLMDADTSTSASGASSSGWAAFGAAPAASPAPSSNTDVFGVFTASAATSAAASAPFDPFASAPRSLSSTAAAPAFDPFSNPAPAAPHAHAPAAFDPFGAAHAAPAKPAAAPASSGWAAFGAAPEPPKPAAPPPASNDWAAFGAPAHPPAGHAPPGGAFDPFQGAGAAASNDFQPFAAPPGAAAAAKPAEPAGPTGPKELPSDLFAEPAFPAPGMGSSFTMAQGAPGHYGMGPAPGAAPTHPIGIMGGGMGGSFSAGHQQGLHGGFPGVPNSPGMGQGGFPGAAQQHGMPQGGYHVGPQHGMPSSPSGYAPAGLMHQQQQQGMGSFTGMGGSTSPPAGYAGGAPSYGMAPGMGGGAVPSYGMGPQGGYGGMGGGAPYGMQGGGPPPMMPGMTAGMPHPPAMPGMPGGYLTHGAGMPGDRRTSNSSGSYPLPTMGMQGNNGYPTTQAPPPSGPPGNPFGADPAPPAPKPEDMLFTDLMGDFSGKLGISKPAAGHTNGLDAGHGAHPPAAAGNSGNPFAF